MNPVLLDTDLGTDIDDTWALAMLLNSPEIDLKAVVTTHGDVDYRAALVARLLELGAQNNVPIGTGVGSGTLERHPQRAWLDGYSLDEYASEVHRDGAALLIETVLGSAEPVTVLTIGPASTVAAALEREPRIAENARFVGMHGAIRRGYRGSPDPVPEYNVFVDVAAFRTVLAAPWPIVLTPLDTCGDVVLRDTRYQRFLHEAPGDLAAAVRANYRAWAATFDAGDLPDRRSTTLYDTVAVHLAYTTEFLEMEQLPISLADDGLMAVSSSGRVVTAATAWRDFDGFLDSLLLRLGVTSL